MRWGFSGPLQGHVTRAGRCKSLSSLADLPEIVGFFSYSRDDDNDSTGALSALRDRIQRELRGRLGRTKASFRLWQDTAAIPHGALWEEEIKSAVAQSVFFIPIITPTTVRSPHCKREFELFLARERELGRQDLIFPLLYIRVPELEDEQQWRQDDVLKVIGTRQYMDWQDRRYLDVHSTEVAVQVGRFCSNIYDALRQPLPAPQDSQGRDGVRIQQRAERRTAWREGPSQGSDELQRRGAAEREANEAGYPKLLRQPGSSNGVGSAARDKPAGSGLGRTIKTGMQFALVALVGALGVAVIALWPRSISTIPTSLPVPPSASLPAPPSAPLSDPELVIRKAGAFGGTGGETFDETSANPRHLPISGIHVVVTLNPANRNQKLIGRLQVQWGDTLGPLHGGGPADISTPPAQFAKDETINKVFVSHMDYTWARNETPPVWISGLQIHTNKGFYNFGDLSGPTDVCAVSSGENVIGFFGRSGSYLDQIGCIFARAK